MSKIKAYYRRFPVVGVFDFITVFIILFSLLSMAFLPGSASAQAYATPTDITTPVTYVTPTAMVPSLQCDPGGIRNWGTVTPAPDWLAVCGDCVTSMPTVTSTPDCPLGVGSCSLTATASAPTTTAIPTSAVSPTPAAGNWFNVDSLSSDIVRGGGIWSLYNDGGCYGGSEYYTNVAGYTLDFTYTGFGYRFYATRATNHGSMTITIDGQSYGSYSQNGSSYYQYLVADISLGYGEHHVTVSVVGNGYISVDYMAYQAVYVTPSPSPSPTPTTFNYLSSSFSSQGWAALDSGAIDCVQFAQDTIFCHIYGSYHSTYGGQNGYIQATIAHTSVSRVDVTGYGSLIGDYTWLEWYHPGGCVDTWSCSGAVTSATDIRFGITNDTGVFDGYIYINSVYPYYTPTPAATGTATPAGTQISSLCAQVADSTDMMGYDQLMFGLSGGDTIIGQKCLSWDEMSLELNELIMPILPSWFTNLIYPISSQITIGVLVPAYTICVRATNYSLNMFGYQVNVDLLINAIIILSTFRFLLPQLTSAAYSGGE